MLTVRDRRVLNIKTEVADLITQLGVGRTEGLLNVDRSTVWRWLKGSTTPPTAVLIALRAAVLGQVPGMESRHWEGWSFGRDGRLYNGAGQAFSAGDILAQQYERALIKSLQNRVSELEEKLAKATVGGPSAANDGDLSVRMTEETASSR